MKSVIVGSPKTMLTEWKSRNSINCGCLNTLNCEIPFRKQLNARVIK